MPPSIEEETHVATFLGRCMRGPLLALQPLLEARKHPPQWHCHAMLALKSDWEPCEPLCTEPWLQLWGSQRWQWLEAPGQSAQQGHSADPLHPKNQVRPPSGAAHCLRLFQAYQPQYWQSLPCVAHHRRHRASCAILTSCHCEVRQDSKRACY